MSIHTFIVNNENCNHELIIKKKSDNAEKFEMIKTSSGSRNIGGSCTNVFETWTAAERLKISFLVLTNLSGLHLLCLKGKNHDLAVNNLHQSMLELLFCLPSASLKCLRLNP